MVLENQRLQLVPAAPELAEAVCGYYVRNREFLKPYDPCRDPVFFTTDYQRLLLAQDQAMAQAGSGHRFYIRLPDQPDQVVGTISLTSIVLGAFRSCFLGYKLDRDHLNQGLMTGAIALVTDYAFSRLQLHRIEANVMPWNSASLRVLEKNGYEREGVSPEYLFINGRWEDHVHMVRRNRDLRMPVLA